VRVCSPRALLTKCRRGGGSGDGKNGYTAPCAPVPPTTCLSLNLHQLLARPCHTPDFVAKALDGQSRDAGVGVCRPHHHELQVILQLLILLAELLLRQLGAGRAREGAQATQSLAKCGGELPAPLPAAPQPCRHPPTVDRRGAHPAR